METIFLKLNFCTLTSCLNIAIPNRKSIAQIFESAINFLNRCLSYCSAKLRNIITIQNNPITIKFPELDESTNDETEIFTNQTPLEEQAEKSMTQIIDCLAKCETGQFTSLKEIRFADIEQRVDEYIKSTEKENLKSHFPNQFTTNEEERINKAQQMRKHLDFVEGWIVCHLNIALNEEKREAVEATCLLLQNNPKESNSRFALTYFDQLNEKLPHKSEKDDGFEDVPLDDAPEKPDSSGDEFKDVFLNEEF